MAEQLFVDEQGLQAYYASRVIVANGLRFQPCERENLHTCSLLKGGARTEMAQSVSSVGSTAGVLVRSAMPRPVQGFIPEFKVCESLSQK